MNFKKLTSAAIIGIAAIVIIYLVVTNVTTKSVGSEEGMLAHDFTLPMWENDAGALSDYKGDIIILNFWASWCPPCVKELPDLMRLADDYQEAGVSVVTVNMHKYERTKKDAPKFIKEQGITLPIFFDNDGEVAEKYQITVLPTTYIIDKNMEIVHVIRGEVNYQGLEELITPMIDGP